MSRIGSKPITIPEKVTTKVEKDRVVITGPLGEIVQKIPPGIAVAVKNNQLKVSRKSRHRQAKALHGAIRALLANNVQGVVTAYKKTLKLIGTGFRAKMEGDNLILNVGFSHPVTVFSVKGIKFALQGEDEIIVTGPDKALVGQIAAQIRKIKEPDVYKGKGIRYQEELIKLKPGKAAKVGTEGTITKEG